MAHSPLGGATILLLARRPREELDEVRRERGLDLDPLPRARVDARDPPGMQGDAPAPEADGRVLPARVLPLADERKPGVREMEPDLVVPAGHEVDLEHRRRREPLERAVARDRGLAARRDAREGP